MPIQIRAGSRFSLTLLNSLGNRCWESFHNQHWERWMAGSLRHLEDLRNHQWMADHDHSHQHCQVACQRSQELDNLDDLSRGLRSHLEAGQCTRDRQGLGHP